MYFTNKDYINLPYHNPNSKKGDFGKVMVVGGSPDYYGSPILTACGAEYSGADLITLYLPKAYKNTARNYSLNFFLKSFKKNTLTVADTKEIIENSAQNHTLAIGSGIGKSKESQQAVLDILSQISIPVVIDAEALFPEILQIKPSNAKWVVTPHKTEYKRLFGVDFDEQGLSLLAKQYAITVLVKGRVDYIADEIGNLFTNYTGCAEMRVGGTGDVLAGIAASFIAQGSGLHEAACAAAYYWGKCGEIITKTRRCLTAYDTIKKFGSIVKQINET